MTSPSAEGLRVLWAKHSKTGVSRHNVDSRHQLPHAVKLLVDPRADRDFMTKVRGDSVRSLSFCIMDHSAFHPDAARIQALLSG